MTGATGQHEEQESYVPISISSLIPETSTGASLYVEQQPDGKMRLYCSADVPLEPDDLQTLVERGHSKVYVRAEEQSHYQQYLRENIEDLLVDESLPVAQRFGSLNNVVRDVLATSFKGNNVEDTVDTCRNLAGNIVDLICRDDVVERDLLGVMHHDYYTFTHSANVSYYCVMLAGKLQLANDDQLREIATGGLLHDLGKLDIPDGILAKPRKLTDAEFDVIRRHPTTGFRKLCHRDDLNYGQLMMVYQHHERLDGKGYPVGVTAEEIHDWARVCTVADVFEALTSIRPYRTGSPISTVFEIMDRDMGIAFDEEVLKCWKDTIRRK